MYPFLCLHLPRPLVDLGYVAFRTGLILLVVLYSDATLGKFQYVNF